MTIRVIIISRGTTATREISWMTTALHLVPALANHSVKHIMNQIPTRVFPSRGLIHEAGGLWGVEDSGRRPHPGA